MTPTQCAAHGCNRYGYHPLCGYHAVELGLISIHDKPVDRDGIRGIGIVSAPEVRVSARKRVTRNQGIGRQTFTDAWAHERDTPLTEGPTFGRMTRAESDTVITKRDGTTRIVARLTSNKVRSRTSRAPRTIASKAHAPEVASLPSIRQGEDY